MDRKITGPIGERSRLNPNSLGARATIRVSVNGAREDAVQQPTVNGRAFEALADFAPANIKHPVSSVPEFRPHTIDRIGGTIGKIASELAAARQTPNRPLFTTGKARRHQ